jgi:hypothetical protein
MNRNPDFVTEGWEPVSCAEVRDRIPLSEAGVLQASERDELSRHLQQCEECAAEARFLAGLAAARPVPPADLKEGVMGRLAALEREPSAVPLPHRKSPFSGRNRLHPLTSWGTPAAAAVAVALGLGVVWSLASGNGNGQNGAGLLLSIPEEEMQLEEWMVAGAPVLDALPDDMLFSLLLEVDG